MEAQEGGGVTFGVMPVKRESVIVRNLPPQGFTCGSGFGLVAHISRYEPSPKATPRGFLACRRGLQSSRSDRLNRPGSR